MLEEEKNIFEWPSNTSTS